MNITIYVLETAPEDTGISFFKELQSYNIKVVLVSDLAMG